MIPIKNPKPMFILCMALLSITLTAAHMLDYRPAASQKQQQKSLSKPGKSAAHRSYKTP